jgi:hypothetical protein
MQSMSLTDETPLSLLEECYQAIFSVTKFILQDSIEPSKLLNSNSNELSKYDNQAVYFSKFFFVKNLITISQYLICVVPQAKRDFEIPFPSYLMCGYFDVRIRT